MPDDVIDLTGLISPEQPEMFLRRKPVDGQPCRLSLPAGHPEITMSFDADEWRALFGEHAPREEPDDAHD